MTGVCEVIMDYKKLKDVFILARDAAIEAAKGKDGGSANLDTVTIELPRARVEKVIKAAADAGLNASKINWFGPRFFIYPPKCGIGDSRYRAVKAMEQVFRSAGYMTLIYHQMD
jgi:hypothetical protein